MTNHPLRAYWWRGGPRHGNFGDLLTPVLLEHLSGRPVEHTSPHTADIVAIGSVLEPSFWAPGSWNGFAGFIWGAGRMGGQELIEMPSARVAAVRGAWTLRNLGCRNKDAVCLGDPGLLACLLAEKKRSRYKLGVVPHWSELLNPAVSAIAALSPEILLIDPCGSARGVLENICRCQHILSSSLHGLIVADSLGIPNAWLRLNLGHEDRRGMPEFKYRDYYSIFGLEQMGFVTPADASGLDAILERMGTYERPGLEEIKARLLASFPYRIYPAI